MRSYRSHRLGRLAGASTVLGVALLGASSLATQAAEEEAVYSPPARPGTTQLYWGDTHLHTHRSADAYVTGTRVGPAEAYRFARGETLTADNGMPVKLRAPLDFLVITDHSDYLGVYVALEKGRVELESWPVARHWRELLREGATAELVNEFSAAIQGSDPDYRLPVGFGESVWADVAATADRYDDPGVFTAFIGYEWTSTISGDNLHRIVMYRDGAEKATQQLPFTAMESTDPEDLWAALADYERASGGEVIAIAHNGNVSNGRMFSPTKVDGEPIDDTYAAMRSRWEPVYEVTQVKGDGETHPVLSPNDAFADFETWDEGNIALTEPKAPEMLPYEYARSALREGLRHEAELGTNPFEFGLIGSTDSHTGFATAEEDNFFGKFLESEPAPDRYRNAMADILQESWQLGASGLAAVWAEENTREALFDAIKRREVYATTGPRIRVRFFGGWNFEPGDEQRPDYAAVGYDEGVPMGGDLPRAPDGAAPRFLVVAAKAPDGANLDRVQVVKGWLDADGATQEAIYDVALADGREVDPQTGEVPPVGSTVDLAEATYTNAIGDPELAVVWQDPDFDPEQRAFYYVRVLQIPTPRWTAHDAAYFDVQMPEHVPLVVRDRAYSSPIWYTP